ncbi:hypothetical protein PMAYCL1PPCAC_32691 [Pristionchus mayeri]|uniref:Uncharacterized protein n=1 Tax=Pristionchus mayeri TaxID=1317129 RepID=A0AAN5DFA1_9BILA|nr:hypothetical protein PMAYCL1PPCAC_32691 [Pristionchus mayeri]
MVSKFKDQRSSEIKDQYRLLRRESSSGDRSGVSLKETILLWCRKSIGRRTTLLKDRLTGLRNGTFSYSISSATVQWTTRAKKARADRRSCRMFMNGEDLQ